ncbi:MULTISPECIES: alpha/beta fold hydrolase [Aurantimonadaceae]|uniref:Alpha/beta hydrolase n=1 Tax=Jiella pelagia TaxID=2986949 RepID=A0ABY7C8S7_9HYPH|nr:MULTISPECIES: alpha/beta hydrolase [Aurantimonadaceae]ORE96988.1 putative alpha/beta hydrolase superfamily [Aurantimonas sp. 22II-16-19i]WAP71434.1 alpha/beta hydrolase [Jiella pelagia]
MAQRQDEITWNWLGKTLRLGVDRLGTGPTLLMLPALSSISTRHEMRPLQERLAEAFTTVSLDWPGFGDRPRPTVAWEPDAYRAFLAHVLAELVPHPHATIAAGHAAGYLLAEAAASPGAAGRLCLIAPTWRGPLPTMTGRHHPAFARIARAGDRPVLGALLYRLNVNRPVIGMMLRGHVYADPAWMTRERMIEKLAVVEAPGARHASIRFVTGLLDPFPSREGFLEAAERVSDPLLVIYGANTPRKSKAEIEALAKLPNVSSIVLSNGKLSVHEEYPDEMAAAVGAFLSPDARPEEAGPPRSDVAR